MAGCREVIFMGNNNFKIVSALYNGNINIYDFYLVCSSGQRIICRVEYPHDGQINDNVQANEDIISTLRKRIRKSLC